MSALKRFVGGFATALASQNREDKLRSEEEAQALRMQEARMQLERKYKERASTEEINGEVFEVVRDGSGVEIPALRRKLNPTEQAEYKGRGLRAKAEEVRGTYDTENYVRDKEEGRKMKLESHGAKLRQADAYISSVNRQGRGLDSMSGLDPTTPEGEAVAAQQLVDKLGLDVKAALSAARKRGEPLTLNDVNKAARAAVAASKDAIEAEDRFSMVLRQMLGTTAEEDL